MTRGEEHILRWLERLWLQGARIGGWAHRHNYNRKVQKVLRRFARRGWVVGKTNGAYRLTSQGRTLARKLSQAGVHCTP